MVKQHSFLVFYGAVLLQCIQSVLWEAASSTGDSGASSFGEGSDIM